MDIVEKLQKLGLTEYEARAYVVLMNDHLSNAAKLSSKSGVPRTKIYATLESLEKKGWIKIYSGVPLLFKAVNPHQVFENIKAEYNDFLNSIEKTITDEVIEMKEKFVIQKIDIGLDTLKEEIKKAKTVWIVNSSTDFVKKINNAFRDDAEVKAIMFPGEKKTDNKKIQFREAGVEIVCMVRNKETPSITVILDEDRTFKILYDPFDGRYHVDEMLYEDCNECFAGFYHCGWTVAKEL